VWSSPAVTGGVVYIGTGKPADPENPDDHGALYALDAGTGQVIWHLPFDSPITSSPTVVDGVLFVGDHDGNVFAVWDTA
jgi:outer membrane protein assembly factor BamB